MGVDIQTQAFLDLYIPRGTKVYTPPATEDKIGDIATVNHLEEIAAQERDLLAKLANVRFGG